MRARDLVSTLTLVGMVILSSVRPLAAQTPLVVRPVTPQITQMPVAAASMAGTGSFGVAIQGYQNSPQLIALGNAANVTFLQASPYSIAAGPNGPANVPSVVQIQFASNNQLASWLTRPGCTSACHLTQVTISGNGKTWTLANVIVTQVQASGAIAATMSYQSAFITSQSTGGGAQGTPKAGYDITQQKTN